MNEARTIAMDQWPRRDYFEHYRNRVACTYSITVDLDVTELAAALSRTARKSYIAHIWALAAIANRHDEFRMTIDKNGVPAVWEVVHPAFTVFNPDRESFASVWSPFHTDFATFHEEAADLLSRYRSATSLFPQSDTPPNTFDISSLPWTSFTGFTLQLRDAWDHLLPIFTLGRYRESNGRTVMPLALQIHHAAADGFHTARFIREVEQLVASPTWLTD